MTQGIIISKEGFDITARDPRNVALDTRAVSSLKKLPTLFIQMTLENYTGRDYRAVNFFGQIQTFVSGMITIPHDFGFPPAFQAWLVTDRYENVIGVAQYRRGQTLPLPGGGAGDLRVESDEKEVVIRGLPIDVNSQFVMGDWLAINIFAENLEAQAV